VRLGLASRYGANDFEVFGIYQGDGLVELGGDVEEAVFGPEDRHVGADAVAEVDVTDDFLPGDIDDGEVAAVGAWFADTGIAVDRDVGETSVG